MEIVKLNEIQSWFLKPSVLSGVTWKGSETQCLLLKSYEI